MYKIHNIESKLLQAHYNSISPVAKNLMIGLRDGKITFPGSLGRGNGLKKIVYKVKRGSSTYNFLDTYSQDNKLYDLLCGDMATLSKIIIDVSQMIPNQEWKNKATKAKFLNNEYITVQNGKTIYVDQFNEIIKWLFVDNLYENTFNKLNFIKNLDLKVCPYCGREFIDVAERPDNNISKPPIDHYLPKSKYPFLAVSFYNIIPCGETCNKIGNKGDLDPIFPTTSLENPYFFKDSHVTFHVKIKGAAVFKEDNYDIDLICSPTDLATGYIEVLKLQNLYRNNRDDIVQIVKNLDTIGPYYRDHLNKLGIDKMRLQNIDGLLLHHPLDGQASKHLLYKFHKDIFYQFMSLYTL